jgi:mevalonate kinase
LKYFLKNILKKNKKSDLSIVEGVNKLLEERKRNSEEFKKKYESQISQGLKEIIKDLSLEQLRDKYDKDLL